MGCYRTHCAYSWRAWIPKHSGEEAVLNSGQVDKLEVSVQIYDGESIGSEGNVMNLLVNVTV